MTVFANRKKAYYRQTIIETYNINNNNDNNNNNNNILKGTN
jgi:hypothetical protein